MSILYWVSILTLAPSSLSITITYITSNIIISPHGEKYPKNENYGFLTVYLYENLMRVGLVRAYECDSLTLPAILTVSLLIAVTYYP